VVDKDHIIIWFVLSISSFPSANTQALDHQDPHGMKSDLQDNVQSLMEDFCSECGEDLQDFARAKIIRPSQLKDLKNLEITTFDLPQNENDMRSFEHAYFRYLR